MRQYFRFKLPDGFDSDLKLLLFSMSFRRIGMDFLQVARAIYFALLGFSPVTIGILLSIGTFVSAIHHITFGLLSDRFGRKPFLILGSFFAAIRMVIFALSRDFWLIALGQGIGALGEGVGAGQPVVSGYIADKTNKKQRASILSTLAVTNAIASTIGSLTAGLLPYLEKGLRLNIVQAHSVLFWFGALTSVLSVFFLLKLRDVKLKKDEKRETKKFVNVKSWSVIGRFAIVRSTSGLGWGFIQSLLSLYFFIRFGVGSEILGPIYALTRFLSIFSYLIIPRIIDRFGEITPLIFSRLISAFFTIIFSLTTWYPLAIVLLIIMRTVIMFTMPIRQNFAIGIVDPKETATAIGITNFVRMMFRSLAPAVAGYMFETVSLSLPFLSGAGLLTANAVLYKHFYQQKDNQLINKK